MSGMSMTSVEVSAYENGWKAFYRAENKILDNPYINVMFSNLASIWEDGWEDAREFYIKD